MTTIINKSWLASKEYNDQRIILSPEEFLASYTQPIPKECQAMNDKFDKLFINTYGRLPNPEDITFDTIIEGDKTYLIVEKKKKKPEN